MVAAVVTGPRAIRLRCLIAETGGERRRGLKWRERLAPDEALLIPNASSVHTFGMRQSIVVARLDAGLRVIDVRVVAPRRVLAPIRRARHVLECSPRVDLLAGDVLRLDPGTA